MYLKSIQSEPTLSTRPLWFTSIDRHRKNCLGIRRERKTTTCHYNFVFTSRSPYSHTHLCHKFSSNMKSLTYFLFKFYFSSVCINSIIQTNSKREKIGNKNFNTHPLFHQNTFKHLGTKRWKFSKPEVWMCTVADVNTAVTATIFTQLSWTGSPFNVICT